MDKQTGQVFISHRHESDQHVASVRALAEKLRSDKVDVTLDQFFLDQNAGGPDEG